MKATDFKLSTKMPYSNYISCSLRLIRLTISELQGKICRNKHFDACIYLPPYKLDVLKIAEYKFSCEMEAHVEVTTSKRHFNV